jgi:hypothetical protein
MSSILKVDQLQDSGGNNLVTSNGSGVITAAGFGKVGQVVSATSGTSDSTTSISFVDSSLLASITPSSTSSKILIIASFQGFIQASGALGKFTIFRGNAATGTNLGHSTYGMSGVYGSSSQVGSGNALNFLDSPSTTASTQYTLAFSSEGGNTNYVAVNGQKGSITLMEILP